MAGKEIYIGAMLEAFNTKMDTFSADMAESVEAMRAVESNIVKVAQNTAQLISAIKVTDINPDQEMTLNTSSLHFDKSTSSTSDVFVSSELEFYSFSSGTVKITIPQVKITSVGSRTVASLAIKCGDKVTVIATGFGTTVTKNNISAVISVNANEKICIGFSMHTTSSSYTANVTGDFAAGIKIEWAMANIADTPFIMA